MGNRSCPPFYRRRSALSTAETLFSAVDLFKDHDDRKALVLGSGTSLKGFDFSKLADESVYVFAINDEGHRNRDQYVPEAWIFFDLTILNRYRDAEVPSGVEILTTKANVVNAIKGAERHDKKPVPEWVHRIRVFETCRIWDPNTDLLLMHRTTASAALCLAVKMGFKQIGLAGTDFYTPEDQYYYVDGQGPRVLKKRARNYIDDDIYMEPRHIKMVHDMTRVKEGLDRAGIEVDIHQTSMRSPLDCFQKTPIDEFLSL